MDNSWLCMQLFSILIIPLKLVAASLMTRLRYVVCRLTFRVCIVDHCLNSIFFSFFTFSFYLQKSQPNETWQQVNKNPIHFVCRIIFWKRNRGWGRERVDKQCNSFTNISTEKEAAAGFLRIGSLNVRVKKTTEAFNNLLSSASASGTFSTTKIYNKPWGSTDNLPNSMVFTVYNF